MRPISLLIPIATVCGLVAFVVLRVFDTSSADSIAGARGHVEPATPPPGAPPAPPAVPPAATGATTDGTRVVVPTTPPPPAGDRVSAAEVRRDLELRLRDSGPAPDTWAGELGGAVDQVLRAPELQAVLRNAPDVECFAEGCMVGLVFASAGDFDLHQQAIGEATALERWPHVVTGAERQPDGTVRNALVVFRPHSRDELAAIEARRAALHATAR